MPNKTKKQGKRTRILDFNFVTELTVEFVEYFTDPQMRGHAGSLGQIKNLKNRSNTDVSNTMCIVYIL